METKFIIVVIQFLFCRYCTKLIFLCQDFSFLLWKFNFYIYKEAYKMSFGEKVKTLREKKGLTQKELADILGTSSKTVSNYETRDLRPRKMEVYEKMAQVFDVNVNYLLTEEEYFIMNSVENFGYKGAKDAKELIKSMAGLFAGGELPEEDQDALFAAIQEAYWQSKLENKKYKNRKN